MDSGCRRNHGILAHGTRPHVRLSSPLGGCGRQEQKILGSEDIPVTPDRVVASRALRLNRRIWVIIGLAIPAVYTSIAFCCGGDLGAEGESLVARYPWTLIRARRSAGHSCVVEAPRNVVVGIVVLTVVVVLRRP